MFIKMILALSLVFCLCSCTSSNAMYSLLEINNVSIYQYGGKDNKFIKYSKYSSFQKLDEIIFDNFTIIIVNEKTTSMPEEMLDELMELFLEDNKIIFIQGNPDKIRYERLTALHNWDELGRVGIVGRSSLQQTIDDAEKSNDKIFYDLCIRIISGEVYNFIELQ